ELARDVGHARIAREERGTVLHQDTILAGPVLCPDEERGTVLHQDTILARPVLCPDEEPYRVPLALFGQYCARIAREERGTVLHQDTILAGPEVGDGIGGREREINSVGETDTDKVQRLHADVLQFDELEVPGDVRAGR